MPTAKVAITIEKESLQRLDRLVAEGHFSNRSRAVQQAVDEKMDRLERKQLARECAKLDRDYEQELADEGMEEDFSGWPAY